jgi:SPP1 family predicted phage head-tail adaptor
MPAHTIGQLNRRVQLQQPDDETDARLGRVPGYATVATVWASVFPLSGRAFFDARQLQSELSHRITIRYRTDITAAWRVRFYENGQYRVFRIDAPPINVDDARVWLELMCVEEEPEAA